MRNKILSFLTLIIVFFSYPSLAEFISMDSAAIQKRTESVGHLRIAPPSSQGKNIPTTKGAVNHSGISISVPEVNSIGKTIYQNKCSLCHETGVAGAPRKGDRKAWQPRLAQGDSVLFIHLEEGYKAMPPKGTCFECSESDLKDALAYLSGNRA